MRPRPKLWRTGGWSWRSGRVLSRQPRPLPGLDSERGPLSQEIPLVNFREILLKSDVPLVGQMESVNILRKLNRDTRSLDTVPKLLVLRPPAREPFVEREAVPGDQCCRQRHQAAPYQSPGEQGIFEVIT
jgi:hypothetical protein